MKVPELKEIIKLLTSRHGISAGAGSMAGGAAGGLYGGLSEKPEDESRLARVLEYMGLGSVTGAGAGVGGGMAGASLGKSYGPQVRQFLQGARAGTGGLGVSPKQTAKVMKRKGVARGQNAFVGAMTGAGLAGTAAGAGTAALADKYGSVYVQGLMDKCAEQGVDAERCAIKLAGGDADTWFKGTKYEKSEMDYRNQTAKTLAEEQARQKKVPPKEDIMPPVPSAVKSNEYMQGYMDKLAQIQAVRKVQMTKEFIKKMLSGAGNEPIIPVRRTPQMGITSAKPRYKEDLNVQSYAARLLGDKDLHPLERQFDNFGLARGSKP